MKKNRYNLKRIMWIIIIACLLMLFMYFIMTAYKKLNQKTVTLTYMSDLGQVVLAEGDTYYFDYALGGSVSINGYDGLNVPILNWESVSESNIKVDGRGGRCYFSADREGATTVLMTGNNVKPVTFLVEAIHNRLEVSVSGNAFATDAVNYYFHNDGSFEYICEEEADYIRGSFTVTKLEEEEINQDNLNALSEYMKDSERALYRIDLLVQEEYLSGSLYNNDSYFLYLYSDGKKYAIYDEGWDTTKKAEITDWLDDSDIENYFVTASEKAGKKTSKKKLGNMINTGWKVDGVNYFFYEDGCFESISLVNHDFIKGKYVCKEIESIDEIDQEIVDGFNELFLPKKYYRITCNIEQEVYNCQNVNVTSLEIIFAQNGLKYGMYDSNWNQISLAETIDMEARDDFDIFFERGKTDITELFLGKSYISNGVSYYFFDDGSYYSYSENNDTYIKGQYMITDVFDDVIPGKLLDLVKNDNYYYVEIAVDKIWYKEKDETEDNPPESIYLVITANKEEPIQYYIYDDYYGSYDDAMENSENFL